METGPGGGKELEAPTWWRKWGEVRQRVLKNSKSFNSSPSVPMAENRCESKGTVDLRLIPREQELLGREHKVSVRGEGGAILKERPESLVSGLGNWVDGGGIPCARQREEEEELVGR